MSKFKIGDYVRALHTQYYKDRKIDEGYTGFITHIDEDDWVAIDGKLDYDNKPCMVQEGFELVNEVKVDSDNDVVNKPKHYMLFPEHNIEVRDLIKLLVKKIEDSHEFMLDDRYYDAMFISDYVQMMQYYLRFMDKNGDEDIKKGLFYAKKLVESLEEKE